MEKKKKEKKNLQKRGEHWHRLPRETLESPSSEVLKSQLGVILGNLLWVAPLEQGAWTR